MTMYLRFAAALVCGMTLCGYSQPQRPNESSRPIFTVRDSIEMKVFSDPFTRTPGATAKEAPDGRGFVVITTQGHIRTNTLESCLWYFPRKGLEDFVAGKQKSAPRPRLLFRRIGVPKAEQWNSYGSLITQVIWAPDSNSLLLLVEERRGNHHLYRISLSGKLHQDMTPGEVGDVSAPSLRAGTLAYLVSFPSIPPKQKRPSSLVLTDTSMFKILQPALNVDPPGVGTRWKLKVQFRGQTKTFPEDPSQFFPYGAVGLFQPSIAPDGQSMIIVTAVDDVPQSWTSYWSGYATRRFVPATNASDRSGRHFQWPWQYSMLDLKSGAVKPLFHAPTGFTVAAGSVYEARWAPSGDKIVATYTYLPLKPSEQFAVDSVKPCAIAEYSLKTSLTTCIAMTSAPELGENVLSVNYNSSENIVAHMMVRGNRFTRTYSRSSHQWSSEEERVEPSNQLSLLLRQDMDVRPTLWVRNGSEQNLLWDPNPQMERFHFGHASPYHWTDPSGYTWHGGLILPPGPEPEHGFPLVIQTHGFYNDHEFLVDGAFTTASAAQPLACSGIAVLQMEDRAGRHSRPATSEADDEVMGIESAIDHLTREKHIDPSRVGVEGFSRTSWYVETALEHAPAKYKAAVLSDGVDMSYVQDVLFAPSSDELREDMEGPYGSPPIGPGLTAWTQKSPGFNLNKISAAVRLEAHDIVSVLGEWEIYSILKQQGKPVELIQIPEGQHILQKPAERYASQQGAVDWFRRWLQR